MRTAESVTEGHPDKICDQISDAILDAYLESDSLSRVACETAASGNRIWIFGEVSSTEDVDHASIARRVLTDIGYGDASGFTIEVSIKRQSPDIAMGVIQKDSIGAGDQGIVYGYASDESPNLMPLPIVAAHSLTRRLALARKTGAISGLLPDGKAQVTVGDEGLISTVILSSQHVAEREIGSLRADLQGFVRTCLDGLLARNVAILVNPTGRFVLGGPEADAGLTGRKIIVDTYGGEARHGGGAFSGKDATKVDRSGAYAARHAARAVVRSGLAKRAEVAVAYAIGVANPVMVTVKTFGTGDSQRAAEFVRSGWDFRPSAMIERYQLRRPIFKQTATYGHFGVAGRPWEED
jgi:S-adenosylmethionine synthetase